MKEAIKWWNSLTIEGKNQFPKPNDNEDILKYYHNVGDYIL